ncbi:MULTISPECIES: HD domain-containing protein [Niveispirillum]|nr:MULTISPECIES: HD domain-containing protein [Niveispirillum]GGE88069.1 phosphohydrolase [Niveispirillum cyanobacteriorum]
MNVKAFIVTASLLICPMTSCLAAEIQAAPDAGWREKVRHFAEANFKHPAWGYSHSVRDYDLARQLAATDGVKLDDDVLFAAAMLHDMAAFPGYAAKDVDHADGAAELVGNVLKDTGFPMGKLQAVQSAIRTHMFFRDPVGPEALYLHDADALEWLGAIGIARLTATVDLTGTIIGGSPDGPTVVKGLQANLQAVPQRVLSKAGQALVPERSAFLKRYLELLGGQTDDFKKL